MAKNHHEASMYNEDLHEIAHDKVEELKAAGYKNIEIVDQDILFHCDDGSIVHISIVSEYPDKKTLGQYVDEQVELYGRKD